MYATYISGGGGGGGGMRTTWQAPCSYQQTAPAGWNLGS
jgi:hypothetical protein